MILRQLVETGWIDPLRAARTIQDTVAAASGALAKLSRATIGRGPVIDTTNGVPDGAETVWHLTPAAVSMLQGFDREAGRNRVWPTRERIAASYARARGRISSTELGSLVGAYPSNVGPVLKRLEEEGFFAPSRASRRGTGFYYRYQGDA